MSDYRYSTGDSLPASPLHNAPHDTLLYPTLTNTHDTHIDSDSGEDHRGQDHNAPPSLLAIARASYLLFDISKYHECLSYYRLIHWPDSMVYIWHYYPTDHVQMIYHYDHNGLIYHYR